MRKSLDALKRRGWLGLELLGLALITVGLYRSSPVAAFCFAGAALIFIAQGMERRH